MYHYYTDMCTYKALDLIFGGGVVLGSIYTEGFWSYLRITGFCDSYVIICRELINTATWSIKSLRHE